MNIFGTLTQIIPACAGRAKTAMNTKETIFCILFLVVSIYYIMTIIAAIRISEIINKRNKRNKIKIP